KGTLNHKVVTIATLLKDAGYHTYMTGKWNLGMTPDLLPSRRGFERTVTMADTGADNWEKKTYLPIYEKANWFADGKEIDLPDDFYSSEYYIDKAIEFIESNRKDGKPFFSYISFQAVHIPVQAPQEFTDKYMGKYDEGWEKLREKRLERAKAKNIVPPDSEMVKMSTTKDWESLSDSEKRYESKKMAVYAGMVDAMDHHIGRLITYLKKIGQYDNTVFIFTSDNGAEPSEAFDGPGWQNLYLKLWQKVKGYNRDYETLGTRGSYINMGPSFASAAASPLAEYKFWAGEGGMRVPFIVSGKGITQKGKISNAFTFVTDVAPTILEIAGVSPHWGNYQGRKVEPIIGKSLLALSNGIVDRVYGEEETIGYELAGNAALFKGDYKIVKNRGPVGDKQWHLFNIVTDPGETKDLKEEMPERFTAMMEAYHKYVADNNVLPVPEDYIQIKQIRRNAIRTQLRAQFPYYIAGILILSGFFIIRKFNKGSKTKKTVLITGCSSGIGKETAKFFQKKGWNVAATMRTPEKDLIHLENVKIFQLDVLDNDSIKKAVGDAINHFGRIDVLVNNAGYGLVGPFETASQEKIDRQFGTNVFGLFNVTREVLPHFRKNRNGTIINISSVITSLNFPCYSLYASTKHAIEGFSYSLSYELKKLNIKVKVVIPAGVATNFHGASMDFADFKDFPEYGDYANKVSKKVDFVAKITASKPVTAAKTIFKAAMATNFKVRYPVGINAMGILLQKKMYPFEILQRMIGLIIRG
ncbi:MAG: SDR family NAD(P)-dependent oxidoreductase, partial [Deltaproteobacteria bacterium]|nr:SDR family NAD(P)-dependent oxidoreductase [Deltaproteobacteria bacterium]